MLTVNRRGHRRRAARGTAAALITLAATLLLAAPAWAAAQSPAQVKCDQRSVGVGAPASRHIAGTWCRPAGASPSAAIVMVPGATYNRAYWDFPYRPGTYSFARAAAGAGYGAFAIDRLGSGQSSRPLSVAVTASAQARAVHEVIEHLREQGLDGIAFERVLLAGHSLGSGISILEAATYDDVDGLIVTGLLRRFNAAGAALLFFPSLYPAALDPAFGDLGLDLGYVTTRPGTRKAPFHDPGDVDPEVIATDEATKDVFPLTELPDMTALVVLLGHTDRVAAPVLLAIGSEDALMCGPPLASDCSTPATVLGAERPSYGSAPCVDAVTIPGAGHDINLHPSAPSLQDQVLAWADIVVAGGCPQGP